MVFYASAIPFNTNPHVWRLCITACSVEAVDEWYRFMKDEGCEIHRIAPDWYTYPYSWTLYNTLKSKGSQELQERVKITLVNDAGNNNRGEWPWHTQFNPDHTSGKASYIRSKSDPSIFWYDNDGFIVPSKTQRTKFRVVGKTRSEKDHVIIPTDHISISVVGREDGYVRTDSGVLTTDGSGSDTFVFKDFKHSFLPVGSADDAAIKKVEFDGDEWELVA